MLQSSSGGGFSLPGGCLPGLGGVLPAGGVLLGPGGLLGLGGSLPGPGGWVVSALSWGGSPETPSPPVYRITDTCKNITLATTSLRPVKTFSHTQPLETHLRIGQK